MRVWSDELASYLDRPTWRTWAIGSSNPTRDDGQSSHRLWHMAQQKRDISMVSWRVRICNPRTHQVEAPDLSSGCRDYTTGCWPLSGTFFTTCSLLLRPALGIRAGILINSRSLSTSWPSPTPLLVLHVISTTTCHKPNRNSESFDPCLHLKSRTMTSSEAHVVEFGEKRYEIGCDGVMLYWRGMRCCEDVTSARRCRNVTLSSGTVVSQTWSCSRIPTLPDPKRW